MSDVYEVRIWLGDGDPSERTYSVDHRFASLPAADTLVALREEAEATWRALYAGHGEPEFCAVRCLHLTGEERQKVRELREREPAG